MNTTQAELFKVSAEPVSQIDCFGNPSTNSIP